MISTHNWKTDAPQQFGETRDRRTYEQQDTEISQGDLSRELGGEHGSRFTKVDYAMRPLRVRTIVLGDGRHPVEGERQSEKLREMR